MQLHALIIKLEEHLTLENIVAGSYSGKYLSSDRLKLNGKIGGL